MKRWQVVLLIYLISVPIPSLVMQAVGINLYYEQAIWWLVALHMMPLGLVAETLGVRSLTMGALIYWALLAPCIAAWIRVYWSDVVGRN